MSEQIMVLVNNQGELLQIDPEQTDENSILVHLDGYYEVLNEQRYDKTRYDFNIKAWIGVGEQRPIEIQPISETQKLWDMIDYLINSSYE